MSKTRSRLSPEERHARDAAIGIADGRSVADGTASVATAALVERLFAAETAEAAAAAEGVPVAYAMGARAGLRANRRVS